MKTKGYRSLIVYQKAFALAIKIFQITKNFPKSETYSLVDQIRRSSRSFCSCVAEAYRKRQYPAYFVNKCSDADGENSETIVWLEFSVASEFTSQAEFDELEQSGEEIGRMLNTMIEHLEKFLLKEKLQAVT
ncbi:MAG: four helix bundle protein [Flammeovirgaceae bacterium]